MHVYDQEMIAILHAIKKWHHYLYGAHFKVRSDHGVLKFFLSQPNLSPKQKRWLATLQGYDFEISYTPRKDNVVADALSRMWACATTSIMEVYSEWIKGIQEEYLINEGAGHFYAKIQQGDGGEFPHYKLRNGLLWYKDKVYL
ncbi:Ty3/Gypsy family RNase HI domain-containing protein, partial [Escherichia coli]|uniref:Ty3/Gypsy family RNase HI domain-containing protein n=1 Tax=Escherichia coli TaxID=562 RepID=UPI002575CB2F